MLLIVMVKSREVLAERRRSLSRLEVVEAGPFPSVLVVVWQLTPMWRRLGDLQRFATCVGFSIIL